MDYSAKFKRAESEFARLDDMFNNDAWQIMFNRQNERSQEAFDIGCSSGPGSDGGSGGQINGPPASNAPVTEDWSGHPLDHPLSQDGLSKAEAAPGPWTQEEDPEETFLNAKWDSILGQLKKANPGRELLPQKANGERCGNYEGRGNYGEGHKENSDGALKWEKFCIENSIFLNRVDKLTKDDEHYIICTLVEFFTSDKDSLVVRFFELMKGYEGTGMDSGARANMDANGGPGTDKGECACKGGNTNLGVNPTRIYNGFLMELGDFTMNASSADTRKCRLRNLCAHLEKIGPLYEINNGGLVLSLSKCPGLPSGLRYDITSPDLFKVQDNSGGSKIYGKASPAQKIEIYTFLNKKGCIKNWLLHRMLENDQ